MKLFAVHCWPFVLIFIRTIQWHLGFDKTACCNQFALTYWQRFRCLFTSDLTLQSERLVSQFDSFNFYLAHLDAVWRVWKLRFWYQGLEIVRIICIILNSVRDCVEMHNIWWNDWSKSSITFVNLWKSVKLWSHKF